MRTGIRIIVLWAMLCVSAIAQNATQLIEFSTPEQKALFTQLTHELRCLKCQNQTIADSQAGLAEDLRREIREQVMVGSNADQIKDYMVARYGDFVLYRPRLTAKTLLLWASPALLLLLGLIIAWRFTRQSQTQSVSVAESDIEKARSLLDR